MIQTPASGFRVSCRVFNKHLPMLVCAIAFTITCTRSSYVLVLASRNSEVEYSIVIFHCASRIMGGFRLLGIRAARPVWGYPRLLDFCGRLRSLPLWPLPWPDSLDSHLDKREVAGIFHTHCAITHQAPDRCVP